MLFTKSTEYGIRIVLHLVKVGSNGYVRIRDISNHCDVPSFRLSKVAQKLTREGLLESYTGPNGGIRLARPADSIRLLDIVRAVEGEDAFTRCVLGLEVCGDENPCDVHEHWKEAREVILNMFEGKTLEELIDIGEIQEVQGV
ncbi:MAG: Rrf2 family transcriptional regulator [Candidatus Marinimicrobia bacterium]|nr:Rrf2 family transcriptional regulator [Candidatus Neomarinimicrobiota bacterium]